MNLENTTLGEMRQTQKDKYCLILFIYHIYNRQIHRDRKRNRGYQRLGEGKNGEPVHNRCRVSVGMMKKFYDDLGCGMMLT